MKRLSTTLRVDRPIGQVESFRLQVSGYKLQVIIKVQYEIHSVALAGASPENWGSIKNYTSLILVISGGQLMRIGSPTVPIPRDTYIFDFPIL